MIRLQVRPIEVQWKLLDTKISQLTRVQDIMGGLGPLEFLGALVGPISPPETLRAPPRGPGFLGVSRSPRDP